MTDMLRIDKFGRILIPKEVRNALNIQAGDKLELILRDEKLVVRPIAK